MKLFKIVRIEEANTTACHIQCSLLWCSLVYMYYDFVKLEHPIIGRQHNHTMMSLPLWPVLFA